MALERHLEIKTPYSKVTVVGSNPVRRELVLGFEDGSVQTFDPETGKINCLLLIVKFKNDNYL